MSLLAQQRWLPMVDRLIGSIRSMMANAPILTHPFGCCFLTPDSRLQTPDSYCLPVAPEKDRTEKRVRLYLYLRASRARFGGRRKPCRSRNTVYRRRG